MGINDGNNFNFHFTSHHMQARADDSCAGLENHAARCIVVGCMREMSRRPGLSGYFIQMIMK